MTIFENFLVLNKNQNNEDAIKSKRLGLELWKYFLALVIILILIEMVISNQLYRNK